MNNEGGKEGELINISRHFFKESRVSSCEEEWHVHYRAQRETAWVGGFCLRWKPKSTLRSRNGNSSWAQTKLSPACRQTWTCNLLLFKFHHAHLVLGRMNVSIDVVPSCTNWCALHISSRRLRCIKSWVTRAPNSHPAPLGLMVHVSTSSGSDQTRSQNAPLWGISVLRSIVRIWSRVRIDGDSPPWTQRISPSISWNNS